MSKEKIGILKTIVNIVILVGSLITILALAALMYFDIRYILEMTKGLIDLRFKILWYTILAVIIYVLSQFIKDALAAYNMVINDFNKIKIGGKKK